jgi:hypothetical protein
VCYVEDAFAKGERRRRVLFSSGEGNEQTKSWRDFASDAVRCGCTYIEVFTSNQAVDQAWARLGACQYPDAPVLVAWKSVKPQPLLLHGWDRENWTYLAGQGAN